MEIVSARFSDVLNVVELRTKLVSVSSFALGTAYAAYAAGEVSVGMTLLMLIAVLGVDMGTTAFNTYFDAKRGVDSRRYNREADKVVVHTGLSPGFALLVALGCFALAVVFGLVIIFLVGTEVLLVGALSMMVGFLYNGGPVPISGTPLGELFAGGFLGGLLFVLSYYVQTESLTADALWAGLPPFLAVSSILAVNNTCDRDGDRGAGRHTIAVLFGRTTSELLVYALGIAAHVLVMCYAIGMPTAVFPQVAFFASLFSLVFALVEYRRMHRRGYSHETKGRSMQSISRVFLVLSTALFGSLIFGILS
jgi:1,4-dihydroxy-2-naphthoate octaprenyltransferase